MASSEPAAAAAVRPQREFDQRAVYLVGLSTALTTMSFNVWYPFLPLYALKLGATSDADALFWVAMAATVQGIGRLVTGPIWGVLSDRYGRKSMLLRALFLSTTTGMIAAFVQAPWQLTLAMGLNGLLSGIVPPAVALISVGVPEERLNNALSLLTGSQYVGTTVGPALGGLLAVFLSYRASIFIASLIPFIGAFTVLFWDIGLEPGAVTDLVTRFEGRGLRVHALSRAIPDHDGDGDLRYRLSESDGHPTAAAYARIADYVVREILRDAE